MKNYKKNKCKYLLLSFLFILISCSNGTEPIEDNELRLQLSVSKTNGTAPFKVNFHSEILGDISRLRARVPEYLFNKGFGRFIIYSIPDTTHELTSIWDSEVEYPEGTYKAYLIFHGYRDSSITLYSDTLTIISQ